MRSKGAEAVPRNPRERVANGSSMAASNLVAAGGAWVANRWPCCQNADTVSIHSNTSSARAVRIQQSYIKFHTVRHTEKRAVWAAIQTIHRTYLVPRPLYDHTAYTASLSHTAYTLYSPYTIQLTSPPLCPRRSRFKES